MTAGGQPTAEEAELAAVLARIRTEVRGAAAGRDGSREARFVAREEAERLWAVSGARRFARRLGPRGAIAAPAKRIIAGLVRWYVDPLAADQRAFNAAVLRLLDEQNDRLGALEERLARLERGA